MVADYQIISGFTPLPRLGHRAFVEMTRRRTIYTNEALMILDRLIAVSRVNFGAAGVCCYEPVSRIRGPRASQGPFLRGWRQIGLSRRFPLSSKFVLVLVFAIQRLWYQCTIVCHCSSEDLLFSIAFDLPMQERRTGSRCVHQAHDVLTRLCNVHLLKQLAKMQQFLHGRP